MAGKRLAAFTVFALLASALALFASGDSHAGSYSFSPPDGWTGTGPILPMSVAAQVDSDNDGFSDTIETYLGTDPLDNCPDGPADDAWPLDMNMDMTLDVFSDLFNYVGWVGVPVPPAPQRLDLNGDGVITELGDIYRFYWGMIGASCNERYAPPALADGRRACHHGHRSGDHR